MDGTVAVRVRAMHYLATDIRFVADIRLRAISCF